MHEQKSSMATSWARFATMIAISVVLMFFLMYQLVYATDHATFSVNRMVASLVMGCVMAVVMLSVMWSMYRGRAAKISVVVVAALLGATLLWVNRSQALVDDTQFMRSMIPHHSIAINNARKARIRDPRVRKLADEIIESQIREIALMQQLVEDIDRNGLRGTAELAPRTTDLTPEMQREVREDLEASAHR